MDAQQLTQELLHQQLVTPQLAPLMLSLYLTIEDASQEWLSWCLPPSLQPTFSGLCYLMKMRFVDFGRSIMFLLVKSRGPGSFCVIASNLKNWATTRRCEAFIILAADVCIVVPAFPLFFSMNMSLCRLFYWRDGISLSTFISTDKEHTKRFDDFLLSLRAQEIALSPIAQYCPSPPTRSSSLCSN